MAKATEITEVSISKLKPYKKNAKKHSPEQIRKIADSIAEFGFVSPCLIDRDYNIIGGHGRVMAAKQLGIKKVPCVFIEGLDEAQRRAYIIADNKLTELGEWDMELVNEELAELINFNFDIELTGFDFKTTNDWFENHERFDNSRQEGNDEYNEFLDKFEEPKTTDDCYTPDSVYDAVADWVANEYGVNRKNFVRPFYPGGDYQGEKYKQTDIVVDNPPFSIMKEIIDFYNAQGVRFFLFAPCMALFNYLDENYGVCAVCVQASVIYENGAVVPTSFLTNLDPCRARTAGDLYQSIKNAVDVIKKEQSRELPKYAYPDEVATAAMLGRYSHYGVELKIARSDSVRIRELDEQKEQGKAIYGCGLLLSERAAAERAAAERAAAKKWQLSERERQIVKELNNGSKEK